jgi:hypothetical protein
MLLSRSKRRGHRAAAHAVLLTEEDDHHMRLYNAAEHCCALVQYIFDKELAKGHENLINGILQRVKAQLSTHSAPHRLPLFILSSGLAN